MGDLKKKTSTPSRPSWSDFGEGIQEGLHRGWVAARGYLTRIATDYEYEVAYNQLPPAIRNADRGRGESTKVFPDPDFDGGEIRSSVQKFRSETTIHFEVDDFPARVRRAEELTMKTSTSNILAESPDYEVKYHAGPGATRTVLMRLCLEGERRSKPLRFFNIVLQPSRGGHSDPVTIVDLEVQLTISSSADESGWKRTLDRTGRIGSACTFPVAFAKKDIPEDGDAVFIKAKICILTDRKTVGVRRNSGHRGDGASNPFAEFAKPGLIQKYADFSVVTGDGDRLPFSKIILAARSPVFEAMLDSGETAEVTRNEIRITDFGTASLATFLHFLLANRMDFEAGAKIAKEVYEDGDETETETELDVLLDQLLLGDKYDVKSLAQASENRLKDWMEVGTVIEILKVAHLVSSEELIARCLEFIMENRDKKQLSIKAIRESKLEPEIMSMILDKFW